MTTTDTLTAGTHNTTMTTPIFDTLLREFQSGRMPTPPARTNPAAAQDTKDTSHPGTPPTPRPAPDTAG